MIQNLSSIQPGVFLDVIRIQNLRSGRITVPVNPAHTVYARFKHIRGVPAQDGGTPLFRLRVLDNLIDRLLNFHETVPAVQRLQDLETQAVDTLISDLQNRLRGHLLEFPSPFGGNFPETGMLIDLIA